ncbi:MAG: beta strand repeat-containing protein, partial [Pseudomonadota bacterium]
KVSIAGQPDQTVSLPGGSAAVFALAAGTLTVNANGTWAFQANSNLDTTPPPTVSFSIAATDGDGDTDTDSHTITVTDGADATASGAANLTVEESDLNGTGSTPLGNDETDTDTGLSFTTGSDAISLSFAAIQAPTVNGLESSGVTLTWVLDASDATGRTLLGQINGVTAITVTLTGDVTATGGGDVATPTVTAVLSDNFPHENLPDADTITITGLVVNATDTDNEITTGTVNVTVIDDQPDVEILDADAGTDGADSVAEGGTINGTWTLNDGADDVASIKVSIAGQPDQTVSLPGGSAAVFALAAGTLTVNANGTWAFQANTVSVNQNVAFSIAAIDGDGDTDTDSHTITVLNVNQVPSGGTVQAMVDDEGLLHGITGNGAGGAGDITVTPNPDNNESTFAGTLTGSGGDGALNFKFASGSGTVGTESVTYTWDATNNILVATINGGARNGQTLFTVDVDPATGAYSLMLHRPVMHASGGNETSTVVNLSYLVGDGDADTSAGDTGTGTLQITFNDDSPVNFTAQPMYVENGVNAVGSGQLNFYESIGADGGSAVFNVADNTLLQTTGGTTIKSGGQDVRLYGFGTDTLTAKIGADANGNGGTTVFTVKLSPDANSEVQDVYTVQFFRPLDDGSGNTITSSNFSDPSAKDYKVVQDTTLANQDILISASSGGSTDTVNGSNSGSVTSFGVHNPRIASGELLRFDFATNVVSDGSTFSYGPHYDVNGYSFTVQPQSGTANVQIVVYDANNDTNLTNDSGLKDTITEIYKNGVLVPLGTLTAANGGYIVPAVDGDVISVFTSNGYNRVEISHAGTGSEFSISKVGYLQNNTGVDLAMSFGITATDADGDTSTGSISITTTPIKNTINGTTGADSLVAGIGGDTLNGQDGDDWLIGGAGADVLNGGNHGTLGDTAVYKNSATGVTVNLLTNTGTGGDAQGDTYSGVENVMGSNSIDTLTGNNSANILSGLDGNDILTGLDGNDILIGGAGNDTLSGGAGSDLLMGGAGANTLSGGSESDTFYFDASALDAADTITDYVGGVGGDVVDLTDLFTVDTAGGQNLSNYVQMTGNNLEVDVDGAANGQVWTTIATLTGNTSANILYDNNTSSSDQNGTAT